MSEFRPGGVASTAARVLAFLALASAAVAAQSSGGALSGVVVGPEGEAVAFAAVAVTNADTGVVNEARSGADGRWRVDGLAPGANYRVEAFAKGFAPAVRVRVPVAAARSERAELRLTLNRDSGAAGALADAAGGRLPTARADGRLATLPPRVGLVDRFALLTPGVAGGGDADFTNGLGLSANGHRPRSNNFLFDGHDNNDPSVGGPAVVVSNAEAVAEYQVVTNSYEAEYGPGVGAHINLVTRTGTNEFHGALFWHHGNSALDAADNLDERLRRNFAFAAPRGSPELAGLARRRVRGPYRQNRFGGALGGPLRRDSAFFFVTYHGDETRGQAVASGLGGGALTLDAPSVALASALGLPGAAALSNAARGGGPAFAQNAGRFFVVGPSVDTDGDGAADACVVARPEGGCGLVPVLFVETPGGVRPLLAGEGVRVFERDAGSRQLITHFDYNVTNDDKLRARHVLDDWRASNATGRALSGALFDAASRAHHLGLNYTRVLSPRFINETFFTYARLDATFGDPAAAPAPGVELEGARDLRPGRTALDFGTPGRLPQSRLAETFQFRNTFSGVLGGHTLKLGADVRFRRTSNLFLPNPSGAYTFRGGDPLLTTPDAQAGLVPAGAPFVFGPGPGFPAGAPRAGFRATALENLLLGRPSAVTFTLGDPRVELDRDELHLFFQDEWRVTATLIFNFGLRYEYATQPFNRAAAKLERLAADPAASVFDPAFPLAFRTARRVSTDGNNFAPRVSLAWSPDFNFGRERFRQGRTVLRAGFGVAYDPAFLNLALDAATSAPFAVAATVAATPGSPGSPAFPAPPAGFARPELTPGTDGGDPRLFNRTALDPGLSNPYSVQWSLGLQQELRYRTALEVRYVGARAVGQFQTVNANPDLRHLNRAAQCLGLDPGAFTRGLVGGPAAPSREAACAGFGFDSRGLDATGARLNGSGRLDPTGGLVRLHTNGASSSYHALHARLDARLAEGFTLNAAYALSRTIDNASETYATYGGGQAVPHAQNPFDTSAGERALSAFHQKHNFTAGLAYELPFHKDQRGFAGRALGGFQVAGVVRLGSGRPYTPASLYASYDPAWDVRTFVGAGGLRHFHGNPRAPEGTLAVGNTAAVHVVGGAPGPSPTGFWIYDTRRPGSQPRPGTVNDARLVYNDFGNFSLFGLPLDSAEAVRLFRTPFGDVGRNTFTGEPFYGVNLALFKTTNLTDEVKLELRAEAANLFNRRNFGVPDPFAEDAYSGSAVGPFQNPGWNDGGRREVRLGLRLHF